MEGRTNKCLGDSEVTVPAPVPGGAELAAWVAADECPARAIFDRVGDRWSMLVLYHLTDGPHRFNAIRRRVEGISQRVLTVTLRSLERDGLVTRTQYPTIPPQVDYRPTPRGRSLLAAIQPLVAWYESHRPAIHATRAEFDDRTRANVKA